MVSLRKQLDNAENKFLKVTQDNLEIIGSKLISDIMKKAKKLDPKIRYQASDGVTATGINVFLKNYKDVSGEIADEAIKEAKKEIGIKKVTLSSFDNLPKKFRNRISKLAHLFVGSIVADLEKNLFYSFDSISTQTDSLREIEANIIESKDGFITGTAVRSGSQIQGAVVINESRTAVFMSPEAREEVEAYQFYNPNPVSPICSDLAGTIFSIDDPNYFYYSPPLHFNCKSAIVPVKKLGNKKVEKLQVSNTSLLKYKQF